MGGRFFQQYINVTICVCETQMPPAAIKSKYGEISVLHFDPAAPSGTCDVNEV